MTHRDQKGVPNLLDCDVLSLFWGRGVGGLFVLYGMWEWKESI